jgi:hypothetical protein
VGCECIQNVGKGNAGYRIERRQRRIVAQQR